MLWDFLHSEPVSVTCWLWPWPLGVSLPQYVRALKVLPVPVGGILWHSGFVSLLFSLTQGVLGLSCSWPTALSSCRGCGCECAALVLIIQFFASLES